MFALHHAGFWFALALCMVAIAPPQAEAGPPFLTDDPGTAGDRHWDIKVAFTHEARDGGSAGELPLFDVSYGVAPNADINFTLPYLHSTDDQSPRERAWGDAFVGLKWRFIEPKAVKGEAGAAVASVSTNLQFGFHVASSAANKGLVDGGTTLRLPLEIATDLGGGWGVWIDFGFERHSRADDLWFGGAALTKHLAEKLLLGAELHADFDRRFGQTVLTADVGAQFAVAERHTLLLSVGRELRNPVQPRARLVSYVGWQLTF